MHQLHEIIYCIQFLIQVLVLLEFLPDLGIRMNTHLIQAGIQTLQNDM